MSFFSWILNLIQDFEVIFTVKTWWGTALFPIRSLVCKYQLHMLLNKHFVQHVPNLRGKKILPSAENRVYCPRVAIAKIKKRLWKIYALGFNPTQLLGTDTHKAWIAHFSHCETFSSCLWSSCDLSYPSSWWDDPVILYCPNISGLF